MGSQRSRRSVARFRQFLAIHIYSHQFDLPDWLRKIFPSDATHPGDDLYPGG